MSMISEYEYGKNSLWEERMVSILLLLFQDEKI